MFSSQRAAQDHLDNDVFFDTNDFASSNAEVANILSSTGDTQEKKEVKAEAAMVVGDA